MMKKTRYLLLSTARLFWLAYGVFLWVFWLVSVPAFLQRAAAGTLPTVAVDGLSAAQAAATGAIVWGISVADWAWINTAVNGLTFFVFSLMALLIWWRVRTGFGLLTAYVLLVGGSAYMNVAIYGAALSETAVAAWELGALIWPLFMLWLYIFPNGRAVPRQLLWVFAPLLGLFSLLFLLNSLTIFLGYDSWLAAVITPAEPLVNGLISLLLMIIVGAQVYRYMRISGPAERIQIRWFLFGLLIFIVPTSLLNLVTDYPAELDALTFMALPIGIGISILRYRLWDIDVIIRKTLVYAMLSGLLGLIYFGTVLLLQGMIGRVAEEQSPLIIVVSTLLIAALFAPLRQRVQTFIDRHFFRQKYDAQQVLAQFAQTARDEVSLEMLTAELGRVVQETMQPDQISVWIKPSIRIS
jgi:hypothetical protein